MRPASLTLIALAALPLSGCWTESVSQNSSYSCEPHADLVPNMLALVNQARSQGRWCGNDWYDAVPPLSWNYALENAAWLHSDDMAWNDFFRHIGSDGSTVGDRILAEGYLAWTWGENIYAGVESSAAAMRGWLDSRGHCVNIMYPDFTELGAACVADSNTDYGTYWTQVFGSPL